MEENKIFYSYMPIEYYRKQLQNNNNDVIVVNDLGAGSKKIKDNKRKVSQIAKNSLQNRKTSQLLFRLIDRYQCNNIIELGTSLGVTTAYLASAKKKGQIYSLEGCKETLQIAERLSRKLGLTNITFINGNFDNQLPILLEKIDKIDFVYFDGNHTKEATLRYFDMCKLKTHNESVFVFDDINWSEEMQRAWNQIKLDNRVTLTIDLYHIGLVFFHSVKIKSDFKLRNTLFF